MFFAMSASPLMPPKLLAIDSRLPVASASRWLPIEGGSLALRKLKTVSTACCAFSGAIPVRSDTILMSSSMFRPPTKDNPDLSPFRCRRDRERSIARECAKDTSVRHLLDLGSENFPRAREREVDVVDEIVLADLRHRIRTCERDEWLH